MGMDDEQGKESRKEESGKKWKGRKIRERAGQKAGVGSRRFSA